jgi:hypothetical protein
MEISDIEMFVPISQDIRYLSSFYHIIDSGLGNYYFLSWTSVSGWMPGAVEIKQEEKTNPWKK